MSLPVLAPNTVLAAIFAALLGAYPATAGAEPAEAGGPRTADRTDTATRLAQFELPRAAQPGAGAPALQVPRRLSYQYSIGSESELRYRRDADLDRRLRDNIMTAKPQINGLFIWRPSDWLTTTIEVIADQEVAVHEQKRVTLPTGEVVAAPKRRPSVVFDQAFVALHPPGSPLTFNLGRKNYEDERHWLIDTSMDIASVGLKLGYFRAELASGREVRWDLDLVGNQPRDPIRTTMLFIDWRGMPDMYIGGYAIKRNDRSGMEGRPLHLGFVASGRPREELSFWAHLGWLRGRDESNRKFAAHGYDFGATWRFARLPFSPNLTLGYAFGSGDDRSGDGRNTEFRQTGLQSNEARFAGVSKFKTYGEAVDPELGNLRVLTAGLGFRPASNVTVDLVFHKYRLHKLADTLRNSAISAQMNQDDAHLSRKVGSGLDIVVGLRQLFGIRRLGVDLRAGWFFPGRSFRNEFGDPDQPGFRRADKAIGAVVKFWY